jgi:hypothetical protein
VGSFSILPIGTYAASANFHQLRDTTRPRTMDLYVAFMSGRKGRRGAKALIALPSALEQRMVGL